MAIQYPINFIILSGTELIINTMANIFKQGSTLFKRGSNVFVTGRYIMELLNSITVGTNPIGIAIAPSGNYAYVVNNGSNTVSKIDLSNFTVTAVLAVSSNPIGIAIDPSGSFVYTLKD